jgi:hypothetical protein
LVEYIVIELEILLLILPAYTRSTLSLYLRLFNTQCFLFYPFTGMWISLSPKSQSPGIESVFKGVFGSVAVK